MGKQQKHHWRSAAAQRLLEVAGDPQRVEEAVEIVARQLRADVRCPPTNLEEIGAEWGLSTSLIDDEAKARIDDPLHDDGLHFFDLSRETGVQRRFLLAMEIARTFFASSSPRRLHRGVELKLLCTQIALELLVPSSLFHEMMRERIISIEQIELMAAIFDVSLRIIASRFAQIPFVSVFATNQEEILWSYGSIQERLISNLDPAARAVVQAALQAPYEEPVSFFSAQRPWFGSRAVEWRRMRQHQTLFLIRLLRRGEPARQSPFAEG